MLKSVVQDHANANLSVMVVWLPMLGSDTEAAARESSDIFKGTAVRQFWDPNRLVGVTYSKDVFPTWFKDMVSAIPPSAEFGQSLKQHRDIAPERSPLWDVAFLYPSGPTWDEHPPKPADWVKQFAFMGEQSSGITGMFFVNDFAEPPVDSDWFVELAKGMKNVAGKKSPKRIEPAELTLLTDSLDSLRDWFNANQAKHRFITLLSPT